MMEIPSPKIIIKRSWAYNKLQSTAATKFQSFRQNDRHTYTIISNVIRISVYQNYISHDNFLLKLYINSKVNIYHCGDLDFFM